MIKHPIVTTAALALLLAAGSHAALSLSAQSAPRRPAPVFGPVTGSADRGRTVYYEHGCYGCHGYTGESRVRLEGSSRPMLLNEQAFITFLRARANDAPVLPQTRMPNYSASALNDAQAKDLYAFIRSFKSGTPALEDVPVLNMIVKVASKTPAP